MEYKAEHFRVGRCYSQPKKLESLKAKLCDPKAELAKLGEWTPMKQHDLNEGFRKCKLDYGDETHLVRSHLKLGDSEAKYLDWDDDKVKLINNNNFDLNGTPAQRSRTKALLEHKELQTRRIPNLEKEIARIEDEAKRFDAYPKFLNEQAKEGWLLLSVVRVGDTRHDLANDLLLTFQRPTNQGDS
tara:strand:- start:729 stop:1286 length:558 start_codon:yes stop_codon:yes gene_type:complete